MADQREDLSVAGIENDGAALVDIERRIDRGLEIDVDGQDDVVSRNRLFFGDHRLLNTGSAIDHAELAARNSGEEIVGGRFDAGAANPLIGTEIATCVGGDVVGGDARDIAGHVRRNFAERINA